MISEKCKSREDAQQKMDELLTGVLEPLLKKVMPAVGLTVSAVLFAVCYPVGLGWVGLGG